MATSREFGYTSEYLSLLIRKGRIAGTNRGSRWYRTRSAIERYQREVAQRMATWPLTAMLVRELLTRDTTGVRPTDRGRMLGNLIFEGFG